MVLSLIANTITKMVSTVYGEMVGSPRQEGDKTVKEYVASGVKFVAPTVLGFCTRIGEALSFPLKNPRKIDIEIEPLEEGIIYGRYKITTKVPTRPAFEIGRRGIRRPGRGPRE